MQNLSVLDEDLLEIEQTLSAVEAKLNSHDDPRLKKPESEQYSENKLNHAQPANHHSATTFRGVNNLKQSNQKSSILHRQASIKAKLKSTGQDFASQPLASTTVQSDDANLSLSDDSAQGSSLPDSVSYSQASLLPSLSILQRKLKLSQTTHKLQSQVPVKTKLNKKKNKATHKAIKNPQDIARLKKIKLNIEQKYNKQTTETEKSDKIGVVRKSKLKSQQKIKTGNHLNNQEKASSSPKSYLVEVVNKNQNTKRDYNQPESVNASRRQKSKSKTQRGHVQNLQSAGGAQSSAIAIPGYQSKNTKLKEELIQKALSEVPMHQYYDHDTNKKNLKRKYRFAMARNLSLAAFASLLIGYLVFLNLPNISFRVAAVQAGMSSTASIPSYKPAGYSLKSRATYGPGYVKIEMTNKSGNKLQLTQEKSTFDSQALKDNIVARADGGYDTYVKDGLTIYIYNNGGAAWVNKGQAYNLTGNTSDLSSDEILNMAASM